MEQQLGVVSGENAEKNRTTHGSARYEGNAQRRSSDFALGHALRRFRARRLVNRIQQVALCPRSPGSTGIEMISETVRRA